jgi:outer membrane protein OmpA-like peptidoglycan-associated protein
MSRSAGWFGRQAAHGALLAGVLVVAGAVLAQDRAGVAIAVGEPEGESYRIGQLLASRLGEAGATEVVLWESLSPPERIMVLLDEVQLAVVPEDEEVPEAARPAVGTTLDAGGGYRVLVSTSLDPGLVEEVIRAAREGSVEQTVAVAAAAPAPEEVPGSKSFVVYFDFDQSRMDPQQIPTVAEACRYAATLPSASFVLAGHADTVGTETYNQQLSHSRAQSVAATIRNDERFKDALNVIEFGESKPAVPTDDGVAEPMNRRVVITVVPDQTPIPAAGPVADG